MNQSLPLAVAVVIEHEHKFLLIRRAQEPFAGWWSPVAGRVEPGETFKEAARREAEEEIGLEVKVEQPFYVCRTADGTHELYFIHARLAGGIPRPNPTEVLEWGWFGWDEIFALKELLDTDKAAFGALKTSS